MFKGFGKQKEPMIDQVVKRGLIAYEVLKKSVADSRELTQLLAQAVMRFTNNAKSNTHSDETNLIYGRLCVGNIFLNARQTIMEMENDIPLETIFQWMIETPMDELDEVNTIGVGG